MVKIRAQKYSGVIKDTGILSIGVFLTGLLNYIFQSFMGHSLGPEGYGIMSTFFAFIYVFGIIATVFTATVSNFTAIFKKEDEYSKIKYTFVFISKWILKYGGLGFLIYLAFIPLFQKYTNIYDFYSFFLVGIVILVSLINALFYGLFNGLQAFNLQMLVGIIGTALELISAIFLVYLGLNYISGIIAILVGGVFGTFFGYLLFNRRITAKSEKFKIKEFFNYSNSILPSTIAFGLLFSIDIVILKSLFSTYNVGLYSAGSMIGKVTLFGSGVIISLIFPKLSAEKNHNKAKRILRVSLFFLLIFGLFYSAILFVFPRIILKLMYGVKYLPIAPILWLFGIFFLFYSVNNVYLIYFYSRRKFLFANLSIVSLILEVIGLYIFHSSIKEVLLFLSALNLVYAIVNLMLKK